MRDDVEELVFDDDGRRVRRGHSGGSICPWCFEPVDVDLDPESEGSFVQDCEVCCRPWLVHVSRDEDDAEPVVLLERAQ